jgi:hypothetical protein
MRTTIQIEILSNKFTMMETVMNEYIYELNRQLIV